MLGIIGSYIIAYVILAGIELPVSPFRLALNGLFGKPKSVSPVVSGLLYSTKTCLLVLLTSWLIHLIGQSSAWLMFVIPGVHMVWNDIMRVNAVIDGSSDVKDFLEYTVEPETYDQVHDLRTEQAHLMGDIIGWIIGTNLVLQSAGLF